MKHVVLAGAGHAHLLTILNIENLVNSGCRVIVVSNGDYHYYSGMGPGLLSGIYKPSEVCFNVRMMTESRGGIFINSKIIRIQPEKKKITLSNREKIDYDIMSCNLGSEIIPVSDNHSNIIPVKPIENLFQAGREIEKRSTNNSLKLIVIGGGAAGVEIAGNLLQLVKKTGGNAVITLVSASAILSRFNPAIRKYVLRSFNERGIRVLEEAKVSNTGKTEIKLANGNRVPFDIAFNAAGIRPTQIFHESGFNVCTDGGLPVNEFLQSPKHPEIFGGGDCISFIPRQIDRVGVYAVRQGPVLYANIRAALLGGAMRKFIPQLNYLSILNMGDGKGILSWRSYVAHGRFAFLLKNYIDTSFMKRFQVSGERNNNSID